MTKQTRLKLRKGFVKVPLSYRILAVNQINPKDRKVIAKTLVKVTNPTNAKKLVGVGSKWGYAPLAYLTDRVGVITYKGIEVAILYKRVTTMVVPDPQDPVPENTMEDADDVWIRFDLFGMSFRQQSKAVRAEVQLQETEVSLLQTELDAANKLIDGLQKQVKGQQTIVKKGIKEAMKETELRRYLKVMVAEYEKEQTALARKRK